MIPVVKEAAPVSLARRAGPLIDAMCDAYEAQSARYLSGELKFEFKSSVYASDEVKSVLARCHHGKCCYCETKIPEPYAHSHVEHYRPKAYSQQTDSSERTTPGYYWLAYDWDNLLLSCAFCNVSNKRNLFPLRNDADRAVGHDADISKEAPDLLKPDQDDVSLHIGFHRELPIALSERGLATIRVLDLDSPKHEFRMRLWAQLERYRALIVAFSAGNLTQEQATILAKMRDWLERSVDASEPYAAMARHFASIKPLPAVSPSRA